MFQTFCDILWLYFLVLSNVEGDSNVGVYSGSRRSFPQDSWCPAEANPQAALYDLAKFL